MSVKLHVGNLPYGLSNQELEELFERVGVVKSVNIVIDRDTGRSRGFAFVEMESAESAVSAIDALNGCEVNGRQITVNEAGSQSGVGLGAATNALKRSGSPRPIWLGRTN